MLVTVCDSGYAALGDGTGLDSSRVTREETRTDRYLYPGSLGPGKAS